MATAHTPGEGAGCKPVTDAVWVLVLHYQNAEDTRRCLQSLRSLDYPNVRVLLLDNGSPDFSGQEAASGFSEATFVRLPDNLGFAGGCNAGVSLCKEQGAKWVWLLNNDTLVEPGTLSALMAKAESSPKAGLLGAQVYTAHGEGFVPSGGGEIDFVRGKTHERKSVPDGCSAMECDWISGCNLLVRVDAFQSVGGFDESFFLYFEDTDLCMRLRQAGWQCLMVPSARINHIGLRSTEGARSTWRHYYYIRNRLLFFHKHLPSQRRLSVTLAVTGHLARHSLTLPFRGEKGRRRLKAELLGYRDYWQHRFGKATCLDW